MTNQSLISSQSQATIETWLINWTTENLDLETKIDINQSFLSYDMNSVTAMMLVGDLEDWLGLSLSPTLVWDYPDIKTLAEYLVQESNTNETQSRTEPDTNIEQLLDNIDKLSEADMDNLLNSILSK